MKNSLLLVLLTFLISSCSSLELKKADKELDKENEDSKAKKLKQQREHDRLKDFQDRHDKGSTNW